MHKLGLAPILKFNPLLQMASGVHFSFFGTPEFRLSDVPLREMGAVVAPKLVRILGKFFRFEEIQQAHGLENNGGYGNMVVKVGLK